MSVIVRRRTVEPEPTPSAPLLGVACEHCLRAIGEPWRNGKVRLPSASFVREDGQLETRCPHCTRFTTLPYRRVTHD